MRVLAIDTALEACSAAVLDTEQFEVSGAKADPLGPTAADGEAGLVAAAAALRADHSGQGADDVRDEADGALQRAGARAAVDGIVETGYPPLNGQANGDDIVAAVQTPPLR